MFQSSGPQYLRKVSLHKKILKNGVDNSLLSYSLNPELVFSDVKSIFKLRVNLYYDN